MWLGVVMLKACFGDERDIFSQDVFKQSRELENIVRNIVDSKVVRQIAKVC